MSQGVSQRLIHCIFLPLLSTTLITPICVSKTKTGQINPMPYPPQTQLTVWWHMRSHITGTHAGGPTAYRSNNELPSEGWLSVREFRKPLAYEALSFQRATGMDAYEATGSSEDPEVRQAFSDSILHILRPLSVLELPGMGSRCENDSDSTRSALSEPFSDLDESYILLDQRKKKPGKDEGDDMMLLNQFTSEFREVYDQLIGELDGKEEPILPAEGVQEQQDFTHELSLEDTSGFSPPFQSFIDEMLLKCDLKYHLDEKKKQHDLHRRKHRRVRKVHPTVPKDALEPAERDSLSGVWRMLDAMSEPNGFPITEGQYDLYEDERFEWLLREKIPWQRMEVSRKKCEQWLKIGPNAGKLSDEKRSRQSHRASSQRRW